ncbi:MAG: hypothetical protein IJH37_03130 [Clostridia bacterium]|nr:hypothetical protein [Clostridia bacterium]
MNIKLELLKDCIHDIIDSRLADIEINADEIADTTAIKALSEIQNILASDLDDFEIVEKIVCVFEKYNLNAGGCHDF